MDDDRRELAGGWVAITDGLVTAVGSSTDALPHADAVLSTPPAVSSRPGSSTPTTTSTRTSPARYRARRRTARCSSWLTTLYPLWARLDEEAAYVSAWIGLAELALGGCTTSTDHLYVHPADGAT